MKFTLWHVFHKGDFFGCVLGHNTHTLEEITNFSRGVAKHAHGACEVLEDLHPTISQPIIDLLRHVNRKPEIQRVMSNYQLQAPAINLYTLTGKHALDDNGHLLVHGTWKHYLVINDRPSGS